MPFIDRLERKFGWVAVPGIVKVIMAFQALVWFLSSYRQDTALVELISLDVHRILSGEVWRLVSFVFVPPVFDLNMFIWMLFAVIFTIFLGNMLESIWGSFRLTLYVIGGILAMIASEVIFPELMPFGMSSSLLLESLLFACAVYNPHYSVMLFGIIPIKLYWIALFAAGHLIIGGLTGPLLGLAFIVSLGNFFVVFVPGLKKAMQTRAQVTVRRRKFESEKISEHESLHLCVSCGKTEDDDEDMVFRVADDGKEYCADCRGKNALPSPSVNDEVSTESEFPNDRPPKREIPKKRRPGQRKE